jgi:hypothetical protein
MAQIGLGAATDLAFGIVFGLFVLAFVVLAFVAIRWSVRRDRPGREAWRRQHLEARARQNGAAAPGSIRPTGKDGRAEGQ